MSAVSVEGVGISASCPSTVATNTTTSFQGTVSYRLVKRGTEDALVNVLVELLDSDGNRTEESQTFRRVAAGESSAFEHTLRLSASYQQPGRVTVTMQIKVSGAATLSDSTECGFVVA